MLVHHGRPLEVLNELFTMPEFAALADRGIHIGRSCTHDPVPGRPFHVRCGTCNCCACAGSGGYPTSWRPLAQRECPGIHLDGDRNIRTLRSDTRHRAFVFNCTAVAEPGCARIGVGIAYFRLDKSECMAKPSRKSLRLLDLRMEANASGHLLKEIYVPTAGRPIEVVRSI